MAENHKLWGGRFEASLEKWVEEFGASISFDQKMAEFDLKGSIAHVTMLGETGIITKEESLQIKQGLEELLKEYKAGKLEFDVSNEDIHMKQGNFIQHVLVTTKLQRICTCILKPSSLKLLRNLITYEIL